jgi:hypothetical protein
MPRLLAAAILAAMLALPAHTAAEAASAKEFAATLGSSERQQFLNWHTAQTRHDRALDAYWDQIEAKRKGRRPKRSNGQMFAPDDYVWTFPPEYSGPGLSSSLRARWQTFQASKSPAGTKKKSKPQPDIGDFLAAAKKYYGFVPERISEREFKRRYAAESLALGLSKDQVVRVYALETGGNGTADMQAGINPITKRGRPISSALGYAQLLHANTIGELVKHGNSFLKRLREMARNAPSAERRQALQNKIAALERMMKAANSVPNDWYRHVDFAKTPQGYGMHAINLDGDIGPWLQSIKLKGLKNFAARKGVTNLSGEEIELMNLSGPATGLEMMQPVGLTAPTTNFFSRRAYYVNKMVIGKTSAELLAEFTKRMDRAVKKDGAVEFRQAFEEVGAEKLPWR